MKEIFTSHDLFTGWAQNVVPTHNIKTLSENRYYLMGKMIATSLIQGGSHQFALVVQWLTTSYLMR